MEIIEQKDNKLKVVIDKINPVIANTLRRVIMTEVPVMAIDTVTLVKNNSGLFDEVLAHRLGLVPLKTDLKPYNLPSECKCDGEGCALCQVNLTMDIKGPCTVYSRDLKSDDDKIVPVHEDMPLTKLNEKIHSLKLEAVATLGRGTEHAKYSPGLVFYHGYPDIKISDKLENGEEIAKVRSELYEFKNGKLKIKDITKCDLSNAGDDIAKPKGAIEVSASNEKFIFNLESWGQLSHKEIFREAFKIIDSNLDDFSKEVKKIK
jgi:DNA-directed RNA polymerase subunit D